MVSELLKVFHGKCVQILSDLLELPLNNVVFNAFEH